jgi:hypothetical protein
MYQTGGTALLAGTVGTAGIGLEGGTTFLALGDGE